MCPFAYNQQIPNMLNAQSYCEKGMLNMKMIDPDQWLGLCNLPNPYVIIITP